MKNCFKTLLSTTVMAVAAVGSAQAAPIAITNHSFESGTTGWSGSFGQVKEALTASEFGYAAPDGDDVKFTWAKSQNSWQVLSATLAANTTYTLQMDFMHGAGGEQTITSMLALGYGAGGPGSGVELARITSGDAGAPIPTSAGFETWTLTFTTAASSPAGEGQALWIQLGPNGSTDTGRAGYDNVRLDATLVPEPGSLALLGLGGLLIARRRRA